MLDLARMLDSVNFEMSAEQTSKLQQTLKLHNVYTYFGTGDRYAVRMRIAGRQQVVGVTHRMHVAARFADMAHLYLVNLGIRNFHKNVFNFDRETATADLKHPTAAPLLAKIVSFLYPNGVPAKREKSERKSLRSDLAKLAARVNVIWNHLPSEIKNELKS